MRLFLAHEVLSEGNHCRSPSLVRHCLSLIALATIGAACHRTLDEAAGEVLARVDARDIEMRSASGGLHGTLRLVPMVDGSVRLRGTLTDVPAGRHGIHLHAIGRCDGPTFESAGGHFNPAASKHGLNNPDGPHAGDAPNIEADGTRRAVVDVSLGGGSATVLSSNALFDDDGAAVLVHAQEDDQVTDPSGNSGARVACGVVRKK
jgi:Cu-Zn family superoxide dismutase